MMIKIILILIIFISTIKIYAQLPNQNTYLLANLDNYNRYSALWGYVSPEGREYAILGCDTGTSFVDITDSTSIHEVDFVSGVLSTYREMKTYSHYAYVVSEGTNSKLQIIDLQYLPDSVSLVNTWNYSGYTFTHSISQSGPYLYLNGGNACANGGVQIIDITDPVLPVRRGNNTLRYVHDCRVFNDTIWACNILNQKVAIISATNKDNLPEIRNFNTAEAMPHNCAITNDRKYILVSHENADPGKIEIFDIQDLQNITYVKSWQPTDIKTSVVHNVEIYDTIAIAAHYTAGIRIINIKDPVNPVEIAWYDTRPIDNLNTYNGCWAVYKFASGKIIGSDISNGLFVIKTTVLTSVKNNAFAPGNFSLSQNYPNPFNPKTKIKYSIPNTQYTILKVYDILGNEISTLVNKEQNAGKYSVEWDASNYPSGIYFYELMADGIVVDSKKMSLIK